MTDTHTHILPAMDDGAKDLGTSIAMLRASREQGVDTVVLTPHYYPQKESVESFLERRSQALTQLRAAWTEELPRLVVGAEVAWCPILDQMEDIQALTMGETDLLLLEMPYEPWAPHHLDSVYRLMISGGVLPVLAHVERYLHLQHDGQFEQLQHMSLPMQLSAGAFSKLFQRSKFLKLLQEGSWMIGSDCHDMDRCPPCMEGAAQYLRTHTQDAERFLNWKF